jgi:hypothetical protein
MKQHVQNIDTKNIAQVHAFVEEYLKPKSFEKKQFGEVFTPLKLVREMLDAITKYADKNFWNNHNMKILDPAAGIGNFPLIAFELLMNGLKDKFKNTESRKKHILEKMLYMVELNGNNVRLMNKIFNGKKYKLNIVKGDYLQDKTHDKLKKLTGMTELKFDLVMGNPPYQKPVGPTKTQKIWNTFVMLSLRIINDAGYLTFVHPSGWRNIDGDFKEVQTQLLSRDMKYLEIHNEKDGIDVFGTETRYDWYVVKNIFPKQTKTTIKFQDKKIMSLNVIGLQFIPNGNLTMVKNLVAKNNEPKVKVLYSRSKYGTDKSWMSKEKTIKNKYPCVYTVTSQDKPTLFYSSKQDEHFGVSKLIWSNGRISSIGSYVDENGEYGLTQFSYAIVDEKKNLPEIKKAFDSKEFRYLMELCAVGQLTVNYKIISIFKKDFWKEFV